MNRRLFSLALTLSSLLLAQPLIANNWAPTPHLTVEGEARLTLEADLADLQASYSSEHSDSRLALQELESTFGNLLRSLRRQVPEGARLEAGEVRISPNHSRQNDTWKVTSYTATRSLKLTDLPVAKAGEWLDKLAQGQPSQLGPMVYRSSQADSQQHPALELALEEARNKAQVMAGSLGQNLGSALQIEEISSPGIQPRAAVMAASRQADSTPELEPGLVEATARVRVVFELLN